MVYPCKGRFVSTRMREVEPGGLEKFVVPAIEMYKER